MLNVISTCRDILCVDINVDKRCVDHSTSGEGTKNYLPKEEGREGGEKARGARPPGPGLEPGTWRVLGEGPQLHAMGVVQTS